MRYVDNEDNDDPRVNLAIEEHLLRNVKMEEPLLLFYINEPSVIIGRNQNTAEEFDPEYVKANGIHVIRRLSGGGAVYHDHGNLNFSFVTPDRKGLHDFARFTDPVITVLRSLGVEAELRGKSDIFASSKKISGNAQYAASGRMFSHGTLLFDTNIENMLNALNPRQAKIESKAVQSVRSFVANIRELLPEEMDIVELKYAILAGIFGDRPVTRYDLTSTDWQQINEITAQRYATWDWNYGRSPQSNVRKSEQTTAGKIDVHLEVERGRIRAIKFYGNFAGLRDVTELEKTLVGLRYERDDLVEAIAGTDITQFFGQLSDDELLDLLF